MKEMESGGSCFVPKIPPMYASRFLDYENENVFTP